jgi:DNA-binding IclR family transcriptional regulator
LFSRNGTGATVDEVTQATKVPISSVKRVLILMAERGDIGKDGARYFRIPKPIDPFL